MNSNIKLNQLVISYGISQPEELPTLMAMAEDQVNTFGETDAVLREWALTCERYEKQILNATYIGGLVNYVRLLKKEDLIKIILDYSKKYPELNSKVKLNQPAVSYGISEPEELPGILGEETPKIVRGLEDQIWRMPDDTLSQWALTCEKFDRTSRKVELDIGFNDYISRLSKEQKMNIILDYSKIYPELNSGVKLTDLEMSQDSLQNYDKKETPHPEFLFYCN